MTSSSAMAPTDEDEYLFSEMEAQAALRTSRRASRSSGTPTCRACSSGPKWRAGEPGRDAPPRNPGGDRPRSKPTVPHQPGSVGQPRDRDPGVVRDVRFAARRFTLYRVIYNVEAARRRILQRAAASPGRPPPPRRLSLGAPIADHLLRCTRRIACSWSLRYTPLLPPRAPCIWPLSAARLPARQQRQRAEG